MKWILCALLWTAAGNGHLIEADFARGLPESGWDVSGFRAADGVAVASQGALVTTRSLAGDMTIDVTVRPPFSGAGRLEVRFGAPPVNCRFCFGSEGRVELGAGASDPLAAAVVWPTSDVVRLRVLTRGGAAEAYVGQQPVLALVLDEPLAGGPVAVSVAGGECRIQQVVVDRLPWWKNEVELVGDTAPRAEALVGRPAEDFILLPPLPSRIDPVFRVAVAGEDEPLVVRACGVRRSAEDLPLLEQALALLRVRPYLKVRVLQGEQKTPVTGRSEFGPFEVTESPVVVEADGLVGIVGEWPALTIWDADQERILDRTLPGGPAGRGAHAEIPEECTLVKVVLSFPDRDPIEHELVIRRR